MTEAKLSRSKNIAKKNQPPGVDHPDTVAQVASLEKNAQALKQRADAGERISMLDIVALLNQGEACDLTCREGIKCLPHDESVFVRLEYSFPREMMVAPERAKITIGHVTAATQAFCAAAAGQPFTSRREIYAAAYAENRIPQSFKPLI